MMMEAADQAAEGEGAEGEGAEGEGAEGEAEMMEEGGMPLDYEEDEANYLYRKDITW